MNYKAEPLAIVIFVIIVLAVLAISWWFSRKAKSAAGYYAAGGNIHWSDIESLFVALGADVSERAGSRIAVVLFDEVRVFHRPHPSPCTDKGAVVSIRKWLEENEVTP